MTAQENLGSVLDQIDQANRTIQEIASSARTQAENGRGTVESMAAIEQALLGAIDFLNMSGRLLAQQVLPRLILAQSEHGRRFGCGEILGACGLPFFAALDQV